MIYLSKQFAVEDGLIHLKCESLVVAILDRGNCLACNKSVSKETVAKARLLGAKVEDIKDVDFIKLVDYSNVLPKEAFVRFAILCAESVLSTFEKDNPKDTRPRGAIQAAKDWLANPTEENRLAAHSAADSATNAAYNAARSAAYNAARSAAYAAVSVANAACSAAYAAAYAAWAADSAAAAWAANSAELRAFWHKALGVKT